MKPDYDSTQHLHLGYYEDDNDIEAVAYKRLNEEVWDVYLDLEDQQVYVQEPLPHYVERYGHRIFSLTSEEVDSELGDEAFEKWLIQKGIIEG